MVITDYNPDWPCRFREIKEVLEENTGAYTGIEHVGSTAVKNMCAKPVIDIDIIIKATSDFPVIKKELESLGYLHEGDLGISGREAFRRGGTVCHEVLDRIAHNLYVCPADSPELRRHILFRDYLSVHPDAFAEYYMIKKKIIEECGNDDKKKYADLKAAQYPDFFEKIEQLALREKKYEY
ncbi:GrpB family protein [Brucepastera parasyntrophica]|uniref:GrpB family protein n=1 Tax=Brucepastera parasyntrophica TaxID=2880008 RepID=UPI00210ADBEE|nr:GrpB family protein [Brucepastera parasyntrophica]ULQ59148.1 GrpB family protein [Brucepastera parasyntrophica]